MVTAAQAVKLAEKRSERECLIRARIRAGIDHWTPYKKRVDALSRLVMGDWAVFGMDKLVKSHTDAKTKVFEPQGLRDSYVQEGFDKDVSNEIQTQFWAMVTQTAYRIPDIGFEGLDPMEGALNSEYLKSVFKPEGKVWAADTAMTYALAQRIIGGLGWVGVMYRDGAPYLKELDVVSEVIWDTKARHPEQSTWAAQCVSAPLAEWIELFQDVPGTKGHFDDLLRGVTRDFALALDDEVELIEYWSLAGEHAWLRADRLDSEEPFLLLEESPWFVETPEGKVAYLPIVPHRHLQIPRARAPHALVEAMAPHQANLMGHEKSLNHLVRKNQPFWLVKKGAYDEEELEKIGRQGAIVFSNGTAPPPEQIRGAEVSSSMIQAYEMARRQVVTTGGGNPHAFGQQVAVQFSKQVEVMAENAGMMSSALAEGYAGHWANVAYYTLALGKTYDMRPMELTLDDLPLQFGPEDPIGNYLRLTPNVAVNAESGKWKDQAAEINKLWNLVNMASAVTDVAPKSKEIFYQRLLVAAGEKDVAKHFEQARMMAGLQPQGMEAEASLQ